MSDTFWPENIGQLLIERVQFYVDGQVVDVRNFSGTTDEKITADSNKRKSELSSDQPNKIRKL